MKRTRNNIPSLFVGNPSVNFLLSQGTLQLEVSYVCTMCADGESAKFIEQLDNDSKFLVKEGLDAE